MTEKEVECWGPVARDTRAPRTALCSVTHEHAGIRLGVVRAGPPEWNDYVDDRVFLVLRDDEWSHGGEVHNHYVIDGAGDWYAITKPVRDRLLEAKSVEVEGKVKLISGPVRMAIRLVVDGVPIDVPYMSVIPARSMPPSRKIC